MKRVFVEPEHDPISINTSKRLCDAISKGSTPLLMACGGKGLCATCHVYVDNGRELLSPLTSRERISLQMLGNARPSSRLACQAKVLGDGVHVTIPAGRYVESSGSLESLIGRRADSPILHPIDGRVLVEVGKIITRSKVRELAFVDVDVAELRTRSLSQK
ncbi:MAG TPA: 2Fe-2S iron-sulfur cluster-binding protein [Pseudomonadota bacterium]|jgi:ferredoxin|nr:2Fe-2S iron-sulfur cluster-binding protein [Pseudomonadota bacterium]HNN52653.1 2Fe-2S iron-sulfur cluster-binding protein [Pseudomonadota bacterium]